MLRTMLNRRILRIKAFKVLYSYAENPSMTLAEAESQLETSCEATRSLYLFMLSIIPHITREASDRIENARKKFNPTEEEKNPNLKFVSNGIAPLLESDPDLNKLLSRRKLSWEQGDIRFHDQKGLFQGIHVRTRKFTRRGCQPVHQDV